MTRDLTKLPDLQNGVAILLDKIWAYLLGLSFVCLFEVGTTGAKNLCSENALF